MVRILLAAILGAVKLQHNALLAVVPGSVYLYHQAPCGHLGMCPYPRLASGTQVKRTGYVLFAVCNSRPGKLGLMRFPLQQN